MSIFKNSRYTNTSAYIDNKNNVVFFDRERIQFNRDDLQVHYWLQSDRLDNLAYELYGDSQLWWIIMEANPDLDVEWDIEVGRKIFVPLPEVVNKLYE